MIIWGSTHLRSEIDKGEFFCPSCKGAAPFARQRLRKFFTLYFIPLFPLSSAAEYVECERCKSKYEPDVLCYHPSTMIPPKGVHLNSLDQALRILGLPAKTTLNAAKQAYRELIKEYHPDKVAFLGSELREVAERKTLELNLALDYIQKHCS
jgi:DnaJ-domain-containing protein 1